MLPLPVVLVSQDPFEPLGLSCRHTHIPECWMVQDCEFLTAVVAAKSTHLTEVRLPISRLSFLDGYGFH